MIASPVPMSIIARRRWTGAALAAGVAVVAALASAAPAVAQSSDLQPLINTVDRLERQLQALERTVYRGSPPPAGAAAAAAAGDSSEPAVAQLQFKVSQLEDQMRGLTGQIEELGNAVRKTNDRLDRLVADVDFRLRALESGNGTTPVASAAPGSTPPTEATTPPAATSTPPTAPAGPAGSRSLGTLTESQLRQAGVQPPSGEAAPTSPPQTAAVPPADSSVLPPGSPEDRYNYARAFLMRRDFAGAERALRAFIDTYPEDPLAGNAQYWLGETYYVRNDFNAAARTFADGFQRYPGSEKAPDNLLKLGMSLAALERNEDACITFDKLSSEYPKAAANIKRLAEQERTRLKCH